MFQGRCLLENLVKRDYLRMCNLGKITVWPETTLCKLSKEIWWTRSWKKIVLGHYYALKYEILEILMLKFSVNEISTIEFRQSITLEIRSTVTQDLVDQHLRSYCWSHCSKGLHVRNVSTDTLREAILHESHYALHISGMLLEKLSLSFLEFTKMGKPTLWAFNLSFLNNPTDQKASISWWALLLPQMSGKVGLSILQPGSNIASPRRTSLSGWLAFHPPRVAPNNKSYVRG